MKRLRFAAPVVVALMTSALLFAAATAAPPTRPDMRDFKSAPATKPAAPAKPALPPSLLSEQQLAAMADEVAKDVEALRGWKFKTPVQKKTVTQDEARAWMEKEVDQQVPPDKVQRGQSMLRMVGLIPQDCELRKTVIDLLQGQVAGFYDPDTKTLCMVNRGVKTVPLVEKTMMAHELAHAMDDQYVDLAAFVKKHMGGDIDETLTAESVLEGSATALMMRYMLRLQLAGGADMAELQQYSDEELARSKPFLESPRYFQSMIATYMCGMNFLAKGNFATLLMSGKGVEAELQAAVKDLPRSMRQILHPEKYWDAAQKDEPVRVADDEVEKLLAGPGRFIVHKDTLGEMLCAVLTTPKNQKTEPAMMALPSYWTNPAASGWNGDRFYLIASGASVDDAGKTVRDPKGVWLTMWASAADRDAFLKTYEQTTSLPGRTSFRWGTLGAVFFYGFDLAERKALEAALEKTPPKMTRDGTAWTPSAI